MTRTMAKEWGRYKVNVNAVAFGPIRTRLTEGSADGGNTITVGNREIKVGVNPDLLSQMERMIPLGGSVRPKKRLVPSIFSARRNRISSRASM
ncbi:hypothetical protein NTH_04452 (plasmid) [Nitratireductor thuwali]|uniref:SDR family oxidoreductase n=1 Tax=Nitratireductor thuwali TaxID=2267699 RepID=A0ABY5MR56_9HYPH|nr:hypothetical protein NTH_04452 [Nitratireductor thuwali]